ncbi:MAG: hypothetical protein KC543_06505, partial [Myxococcales bacterium]|nr:hypothetical protein [Myxococcales bacterium]
TAALGAMSEVRVAPAGEAPARAQAALAASGLRGYAIRASIESLVEDAAGVRVKVSVVVSTYPDEAMRAILRGSAALPGGRGTGDAQAVVEAALRSALRRLDGALQAADARAAAP